MQDSRFPVEVVKGVPVVAAPEEIDITNAPELRAALLEAAAHGHGTLVADLTRTRFCDSSGLHTLLAAHKRAQADGGEMLLVISGAAVLRVFAITSVDRIIPNFTSLEEALAQTSAKRIERPSADRGAAQCKRRLLTAATCDNLGPGGRASHGPDRAGRQPVHAWPASRRGGG